MIGAALLALATPVMISHDLDSERIEAVIENYGLSGDVLVADGREELTPWFSPRYGYVGLLPQPYRGGYDGLTWRWPGVTEQIIAILIMQQGAAGSIDLDRPIGTYLPKLTIVDASRVTVRQLLEQCAHIPDFAEPDLMSAAGSRCNALVLRPLLEAATGKPWQQLFRESIVDVLKLEYVGVYPDEEFTRRGTINERPETGFEQPGDADLLWGQPNALIAIDLALMRGALLSGEWLRAFFASGAMGQLMLDVRLSGCSAPVRIIVGGGAIGSVEVRNFMFPETGMAIAVFSDRAPFAFGDLRQGQGFAYDLLSAAACPKEVR